MPVGVSFLHKRPLGEVGKNPVSVKQSTIFINDEVFQKD